MVAALAEGEGCELSARTQHSARIDGGGRRPGVVHRVRGCTCITGHSSVYNRAGKACLRWSKTDCNRDSTSVAARSVGCGKDHFVGVRGSKGVGRVLSRVCNGDAITKVPGKRGGPVCASIRELHRQTINNKGEVRSRSLDDGDRRAERRGVPGIVARNQRDEIRTSLGVGLLWVLRTRSCAVSERPSPTRWAVR